MWKLVHPRMTIWMTKGLKQALLSIIDDFEKETLKSSKERKLILMYYGIPGIGKSTLSVALEYYLGLIYKITWYARLYRNPNPDYHTIVGDIFAETTVDVVTTRECEVYIIDQVNPGIIDPERLRAYDIVTGDVTHLSP